MLNMKGVAFNYQIDAIEYVDYITIKEFEIGLVFDSKYIDLYENLNHILGQDRMIVINV